METLMPLIENVGFPIVVTLILLYRIEGKLDTLTQSVIDLPERMNNP